MGCFRFLFPSRSRFPRILLTLLYIYVPLSGQPKLVMWLVMKFGLAGSLKVAVYLFDGLFILL